MIVKLLSVLLKIVAGFFFYMVCVLAFISEPKMLFKCGMLIGFSIPALIALVSGLALTRFNRWRRDTGIVLLSTAGFTAFIVFSMVCMFSSDEFRRLMPPNSMSMFGDYVTGGAVIIGFAISGWMLQKADSKKGS